MQFISNLMIRFTSRRVGSDAFGNQYFEARQHRTGYRHKRYVLYAGQVEASKIPADWHGWLHYTEALPPPEGGYARYDWQAPHVPNMTGTKYAYRPQGHVTRGGKRAMATGDYQAWTPTHQSK